MQGYEEIDKGIESKDVKRLREAIGNICYTNRDLSNGEFFQAIKYVEENSEIKLKDDNLIGRPTISSQKNEFTDEDYARAVFELKKNFCDERIKDVETIGKKLYGKKTTPIKMAKPANQAGKDPNQESHQQKKFNATIIAISGLVALIVILILILRLAK